VQPRGESKKFKNGMGQEKKKKLQWGKTKLAHIIGAINLFTLYSKIKTSVFQVKILSNFSGKPKDTNFISTQTRVVEFPLLPLVYFSVLILAII
jgi:hypothetical protein